MKNRASGRKRAAALLLLGGLAACQGCDSAGGGAPAKEPGADAKASASRGMSAPPDAAPGRPPLKISRVEVGENSAGHYLELKCHRTKEERKSEEYDAPRRACDLDKASARDKLTFSPPVKFVVVPRRASFRIHGDFRKGSYMLKLEAGAATTGGEKLAKDLIQTFKVPARTPSLEFLSKGHILPRKRWARLPLRHLNVDSVKVEVRHVHRRNMVHWMSSHHKRLTPRNSDLIHTSHQRLEAPEDKPGLSWVDLPALVRSPEVGLYEVTVSGGDTSAATKLLATNIHLVSRRAEARPGQPNPAFRVWALGAGSARPLPGVELSLVRRSGLALARCKTNSAGACRLRTPGDHDPSPPFALLARRGNDLTYLTFEDAVTRWPRPGSHRPGYNQQDAFRASMYSERGVYRPGEVVHLAAVVRDKADQAPTPAVPLTLTVFDPMGRATHRTTLTTNAAGMVAHDLTLGQSSLTGSYDARLAAGDEQVATSSFNVEAFVPERLRVTVKPLRRHVLAGQKVQVKVSARYLFGGSAAGNTVELRCTARLDPTTLEGYEFGDPAARLESEYEHDLGTIRGKLDARGEADLACPTGDPPRSLDRMSLDLDIAVFEAGSGRSTVGRARVHVHPALYYVGLRKAGVEAREGVPIIARGVVLNWQGKPYQELNHVQIEHGDLVDEVQRYTVKGEPNVELRYQRRMVSRGKQRVAVRGGRFKAKIPVLRQAPVRIIASAPGARAAMDLRSSTSSRHYWYGHISPLRSERKAGRVKLSGPTAPVAVGEKVTVTYEVPWPARALLALESDHVLEARWVSAKPGPQQWTFTVRRFQPSVYATVLLVPAGVPARSAWQGPVPRRAYGAAMIRVRPAHLDARLKLSVPSKVRPMQTMEVRLDLGRSSQARFATVAAVDEGLLSLTRFRSPSPLNQLFRARALGVESTDTLGQELHLESTRTGMTGGGRGSQDKGRHRKPDRSVALFSGLVPVPRSGALTVKFKVPQYRGKLRVMAVAAGKRKLGSADTTVTVTEPMVLQATLPRFLVKGDTVRVPVHVTNMSGRDLEVQVTLQTEDPPPLQPEGKLKQLKRAPRVHVTMAGGPARPLKIKKGGSATVMYTATAGSISGVARFVARASAGDLRSAAVHDVPVKHSGPPRTLSRSVALAEGTQDLGRHLQGWEAASQRTRVWVSGAAFSDVFSQLSYLVNYPHGCLEQSTSATRPLLALAPWVERVLPDRDGRKPQVAKMVANGIARVLSMQLHSGGFAYWPGSGTADYFGTAYATLMLTEAQKLGYQLPAERVGEALDYLEKRISGREAPHDLERAEPLALYVLARAGRDVKAATKQRLELLPDEPDGHQAEAAYLLMAAARLLGDRSHDAKLRRPGAYAGTDRLRWSGGTLYSTTRRNALVLSLFIEAFGAHKAGADLLDEVVTRMRAGRGNTQEVAWSVNALGAWANARERALPSVELLVNGSPAPAAGGPRYLRATVNLLEKWCEATRTGPRSWLVKGGAGCRNIQVRTKGDPAGARLVFSNTGWPASGESVAPAGDSGLRVQRRLLDLEGRPVDPGKLRLGDMVLMRVTLSNQTKQDVDNIALVSHLPACLEVENPSLGRGRSPAWVRAQRLWHTDYNTSLDTRVAWFGGLAAGQGAVVYAALRVTAAGKKFTMPPVEAEAMYDPDNIWSRRAGAVVRVAGVL